MFELIEDEEEVVENDDKADFSKKMMGGVQQQIDDLTADVESYQDLCVGLFDIIGQVSINGITNKNISINSNSNVNININIATKTNKEFYYEYEY